MVIGTDYDGHGGGEHLAAGDHAAARAAELVFLVPALHSGSLVGSRGKAPGGLGGGDTGPS
mgnify:CR=1 FL=1